MATVMSNKPLITRQWSDYIDLLALHRLNPQRYPFLLASTSTSQSSGGQDRYDILLGFAQQRIELWPTGLRLHGLISDKSGFLSVLDEAWADSSQNKIITTSELPFKGGWFLYLGYELAEEIEPTLRLLKDTDSDIPIAMASRIPIAVVNDRHKQQSWLVRENGYEALLDELIEDLDQLSIETEGCLRFNATLQEDAPEAFIQGVKRVREYIVEGDVFQVNLSRKWQGDQPQSISAPDLFSSLRKTNPAPFAGLLQFENAAIVSSSPERLVRVQQDKIETRPIAGTRPRGIDEQSDKSNLAELIGHPKERAEHVMLIDLERNDLGRVCLPGTIKVNELMVLESYAHVHHIVSNVQGSLRHDCTPGDVIHAVFPGGTITGCPKVRCMEIIAELEQACRGPYTGSMGYLNHDGSMDLNILIRSIVIDKGQISFRAGAGLVADSIPDNELQETRAKAKGMLLSLQGDHA